jgi:two-component system sensor histidine kinase BarA
MIALRPPFTLRQFLVSLYLVGMIALTSSVILFLQKWLTTYLYEDLLENGRMIAQRLAEDSRLPIIQGTVELIGPRLETIAAYPNVAGIVITTPQGNPVSARGSYPVVPSSEWLAGASTEKTSPLDRPDSITMIAPVFERRTIPLDSDPFGSGTTLPSSPPPAPQATAAPNAIGFVALTLSKVKLQADLRNLNQHLLVVMWTGILTFTGVLLLVLRQLTRPIQHLANAMSDPETVRHFRPVEVCGVREAQSIATAFNSLIVKIAETTRELVASNAALTDSQADLARQVEEAVREVMRQNAELVVAREQAEAASRAKSQFVATVSHEIRTPLHGVVGFVGLLAKTPLTDRQKTYLALLGQATDSLLAEINSILDFSQLEAGKMQPRERPFNLKELLETTLQQFDSRARAKRLNLRIAIDPRLPEWVCADRQSLEKILRNLVDNAIKFTNRGQIQVRVWGLRETENAFECHVAVRDTGIGISPEHRATIFQAFHQIDSSITRQQGGSGLGLSICRQRVELMKGRLAVKSRLGHGSTFSVAIPLTLSEPRPEWIADEDPAPSSDAEDGALPALPSPRDDAPSPRRPSKTHRLGGARVLVVDDQSQNRVYAQLALQELDAEVVTAASGHEALEACENQRFDLVLMDVRMPDMDGLEATRRIRQLWIDADSHTPIIGLTADLLNLDRQDWQNAGMDDCQFKPLGVEALNDLFVRWEIGPSAQSHSLSRFLRKRYER